MPFKVNPAKVNFFKAYVGSTVFHMYNKMLKVEKWLKLMLFQGTTKLIF